MSLPDKDFQWIANYTQVPNEFFEIAPYLTEPELRIMLYAIRHTIGWHDKRESREAHISIRNFAYGYTRDTVQYEGTHLTEVTIRKALPELVRLGLLEKVGGITDIGQKWKLPQGCNSAALAKREQDRYEKDQLRTVNGRKKAEEKRQAETGGLSHNPPLSDNKGGGYPITLGGVIPQPQVKKKDSKDKEKESPAPIGDSINVVDPIVKGDALLENAFAVKAQDSDSQPTASQSAEETLLPVPAPAASSPVVVATARKKPCERNAMQEAVGYAFDLAYGGFAGRIGNFFAGELKDAPKHRSWFQVQFNDAPVSALEIIAFTNWYSRHPSYASSFAERKTLPRTPATLRERLEEFRERESFSLWVDRAKPTLERLMQGEKLRPETAAPTATTTGKVESAAYKSVTPSNDAAYADRREEGTAEFAAELFGA